MILTEMSCIPCRGDQPALTAAEIAELLPQLPGWNVVEVDGIPRLERVYTFNSYPDAAAFAQALADLAEEQDHHPAILLEWRQVTVQWWTHIIKGLHTNDFISAARTNQLRPEK